METVRLRYIATRGGFLKIHKPVICSRLTVDYTMELKIGQMGYPVEAVPKPDTIFAGWSDKVKSNPRIDYGSKDNYPYKKITANFVAKYTLWERFITRLRRLLTKKSKR